MDSSFLFSLIIFLPAIGALALCFMPKRQEDSIKQISLITTAVVFLLTVWVALPGVGSSGFVLGRPDVQHVVHRPWIPAFGIEYFLGVDGISFPLVILTSFLSLLSMAASWPIQRYVKGYCILFLLLETGMLGVFLSLDFFLFYVFWEVMLLPMYFLIGVWGGPRREYAAIKFFLFTLVGSVLMLVAILMLYYASDLHVLSAEQQMAAHVQPVVMPGPATAPMHTFNILALTAMGQMDHSPFDQPLLWGQSLGWWAFVLLFIGFVIKLPAVPVHTWLPDAHVEAPTPISMILAGVLLKMGGYGVLRICYPICPAAGYSLAWMVCGVGVVSMVYGALAALAQKDFKRLVAYSSVSHMGYVLLGIGVWSAAGSDFWKMGVNGAMFQMIAHGITSAGMFFLVGVVYDRVHHRDLDQFGGLFQRMPTYSGISVVIFFAALGLPGLCGFIGEVLVVLSAWNYNVVLAIIAASVVILTAGYILWTIQRVYLGPEYKGPHAEALTPITRREIAIAVPLLVLAIALGVYPMALLNYTTPSVNKLVDNLAGWTRRTEQPAVTEQGSSGTGEQAGATAGLSSSAHATDRRRISDSKSQISDSEFQISDLKSEISNSEFQISDLKSEISNSKSQISDLISEISNLKSQNPRPGLLSQHQEAPRP
ncbi:MAG: NADH-quinone oxidoreductase subunit M [Thermoguttaceae bacterium]|jgi:NADH-quinone oxidoreductase subunit M